MSKKITRPTLLLDTKKMQANIDKMIGKAKASGTQMIPHFKTHQSKEIGDYFRDRGIKAITVSSVQMAEYFAKHGWKDITIAFPFNRLEMEAINRMIGKGVRMKLLVTDAETVSFLGNDLIGQVEVLVEIDAGYNRSGVPSDDLEEIKKIVSEIDKHDCIDLYGIYCHPGNTYHSNSIDETKEIWKDAIAKMGSVRSALSGQKEHLKIRMGDTPGCVLVEDMKGVDEIGPGNFVFYDLVMNYLDVCSENEIAVAVACPIVAKSKERNEVIIHGGAVHFSKDHLFDRNEQKFFGEMVILEEDGWSAIIAGAKLVSISQEHGILKVNDDLFSKLHIGDVIGILPIHSCLTANLMGSYLTCDGHTFEHRAGTC